MSEVKWSVIFPAFNEEATIDRAVSETIRVLQELGSSFEIIVVDDGSSDRTSFIVDRLKETKPWLKLIRHERNQGKGAAVRTGVLAAQGEFICFLDCDLSTHPSEIRKTLLLLEANDLIIGSRVMKDSRVTERQSWPRVLAGKLFNLTVRLYLNIPFHDTQCGFKVFSKALKPIFVDLRSAGWAFDVELVVRAREQGFRIQEIPVEWKNGLESHVQLKDMWKIWKELREIKKRARLSSCPSTLFRA